MKRIGSIILSMLCFFVMTGCQTVQQYPRVPQSVPLSTTETTEPPTESAPETMATTTIRGPSYPQETVSAPASMDMPAEVRVQAEDCKLSTLFTVENERSGYTGSGYVAGLSGDLQNTLLFQVSVPSSQHYDISVVMAADADATCLMTVEGTPYNLLTIPGTGKFVQATVQGVYLEAGTRTITIQQESGDALIDCILLKNAEKQDSVSISSELCDPNATEETKNLMQFLVEQYGKTMISGQYVSSAENTELTQIYQITGQLPLIRFADLYGYSGNGGSPEEADAIDSSLEWAERGGVVGLMWHWNAPIGTASVYKDETDFSLANAVTDADIAHLNRYELQQLRKDGTISAECIALIEDIDAAAEALKELQEAGVPVLWRPLQEASNGWFWWGASGSEAYQWLWHLMYTRMVDYHQLHNLIWIWNGQSAEYLVPDTEYDIAAADIYVDADEAYGSRYEQFFALQKIAKNKMVALSECSTIPDLTAIRRDQAIWSFFGLWYGEYLMDDAAGYTTKQQMIDAYNSDLVLTLSEYQAWYAPKQTTTGESTVQTETTTTTIP